MNKKKNRILISFLLTVALVFTLMPAMAFAEVTDQSLPAANTETKLDWSLSFGTGAANYTTPPAIGNDGSWEYVYFVSGKTLYKYNTGGGLSASASLVNGIGYATVPPTIAGGMVLVPTNNGAVEAFDAATLAPLWRTKEYSGHQTINTVSYKEIDGVPYVFFGTWLSDTKDGNFLCYRADDEAGTVEVKEPVWSFTPSVNDPGSNQKGFYRTEAYITDNYLVVSSDDGIEVGEGQSNVYVLNTLTGELIDKADTYGDARSAVTADNGTLYFLSNGGYLYGLSLNSDGTINQLEALDMDQSRRSGQSASNHARCSTGLTICGGKAYFGVQGLGSAYSADGGHTLAIVDLTADLANANVEYVSTPGNAKMTPLVTAEGGVATGVYFTCNNPPGGIYYIDLTASEKEAVPIYEPEGNLREHCISPIALDSDGNLYYKNDTNTIFKISYSPVRLESLDITSDAGTCTLDSEFAPEKTDYVLTVPSAATTLTLEGVTGDTYDRLIVNGTDNGSKTQTVNIADIEDGILNVTVANGAYTREYRFEIKVQTNNANIASLNVNMSNSYGIAVIAPNEAIAPGQMDYTVTLPSQKDFVNLWPEAEDPSATVTVKAVTNIASGKYNSSTKLIPIAATTSGHNRYAIYPANKNLPAVVQVIVKSQDGTVTNTYNVTITPASSAIPLTKTCEVGGNKCTFKSNVVGSNAALPGKAYPTIPRIDSPNFLPSASRPINTSIIARSDNTLCVQWNKCTGVDGYIVLRRVGSEDTYTEVYRTTSASTQYFIDKGANKKNTNYYYICVGYKKQADGSIKISNCSMSVVGVTANSTKKNAYGAYVPKMNYTAKTISVGGTVQLKLNYNKLCFSTWTRWRSDNSKIAKVNSNGLVTGVSPGKTLISGRTPDGRDVRCTITVK